MRTRRRHGNLNCRDGFCGALDCETCYGMSAGRYRLYAAHDDAHQTPQSNCQVCVALRYQQMCERTHRPKPAVALDNAWDWLAQKWEGGDE